MNTALYSSVSLIGVPTDIGAGSRGSCMGPEAMRVANVAVALANHPYHDWKLQVDANQLLEKYQPNNLFAAFQALYGAWCEQQGKPGIICKPVPNT